MYKKITISICEDNPDFLESLVQALTATSQVQVVHVATDVKAGLSVLRQAATDVLLVDLDLPDGEGYELIKEAACVWPNCKVMVISVFAEGHKVLPAIELGAEGYLVKSGGVEDIQHQLQALLDGDCPMTPSLAKHLQRRIRTIGQVVEPSVTTGDTGVLNERILVLPPQEVETIRLIAKGFTAPEVAKQLGLQVSTVRTYLKRIYRRLKVGNKTEALHELGLIDDSKPLTTSPHAPKPRKTG